MLIVLFAGAFIAGFNENIINVGLNDIMSEFGITASMANWLITGYMIVTAIVVTLMAFLLKKVKLRALFFLGSTLFIVGCALAFFAPTFPLLLACRLFQAVGTGIFIPAMMNSVLIVAPRKKLGAYLSIGSCCITFGPAFGPVITGLMVTFFGWRTMFVVPLVVMVLVCALGIIYIRNINKTGAARLDLLSVLLSGLGLTSFVFGLSEIFSNLLLALLCLAFGIVMIAGFAYRQGRIENPLLNLEPLRNPRFLWACALVVVAMMTTFSMSVLLPLYFTAAVGTTALVAGALVLIPILAQAITAVIGGRTMDKRGEWPLLPIGFFSITIGLIAVCLLAESFEVAFVVGAAVIVYAGVGLAFSPSQTAGLRKLDPEMNAHGVSIMQMFIQVAAALGPSLFVGVLSNTVASQSTLTMAEPLAQATGFAAAVALAAGIGALGFIISFVYARKIAGTSKDSSQVEKIEIAKDARAAMGKEIDVSAPV